jgi:putative FmdB family regulatory protein
VPRYEYWCHACDKDVVIQHLSSETADTCPECQKSDTLKRKISSFSTSSRSRPTKRKVGEVTEEFINSARDELKQQKNELDDKR